MTEPESKEPSPEALTVLSAMNIYPYDSPRARWVAQALDAAIAAGAEAALRRQAEVKQPGDSTEVTRLQARLRWYEKVDENSALEFSKVCAERDEALAELERVKAEMKGVSALSVRNRDAAVEYLNERDAANVSAEGLDVELTSEKAAHEATRIKLDEARSMVAVGDSTFAGLNAEIESMRQELAAVRRVLTEETSKEQRAHEATKAELAALRKPLEGELARDLGELRDFFRYGSSDWRDKLLPALSRIEAALQAKGEPEQAHADALRKLAYLEFTALDGGPPTLHINKQLLRQYLEPIRAALQAKGLRTIGPVPQRATSAATDDEPPAETPEPRAIVADSVCARCGKRRVEHNWSGFCPIVDTWSRTETFQLSGPEPAALAPLEEPSK